MQSFIVSVALIITSIFFLDILVMALGVNFSRVMTFRGWIVEQSLCLWVAALENYRLVYSRLWRINISIQLVQTNQQRQRKCSTVWFFCEVCMLRLGHISNWIVLNSQGWWWVWAKRDGIKLSSGRLVCFWCSFVALVCPKKSLWLCSISIFSNLFTKQLVILY